MKQVLCQLWHDEDGQGLVEYGLIVALVSIALVAGLQAMQGALYGKNDSVYNRIIDPLRALFG